MKKVRFTNCWVGCYVGDGEYEGGSCPDVLITNVPDHIEDSDLFNYYLMGLCDGFCEYEVIKYKSREVKRQSKTKIPTKITSLKELENCCKEFIEVDYNDLIDWIFE
jgi:hypothetical protein